MKNEEIVILIPAYNPTEDLIPLSKQLLENGFKVVVVNDGSKEELNYIFEKLDKDVTLLVHPQNMGKGQALKTGMKYIDENIDCIGLITADADGQHICEDIINVANELKNTTNTLVLGSRLDTSNMPKRSKFGNSITRAVFHFASHVKVFDTQTGLRGIPKSCFKDFLEIEGQRYEYEINMLIFCAQEKIKIKEINIHTIYIDDNKSSSFKPFKDSVKIYKCIFKNTRFLTGFLYILVSLLSAVIDIGAAVGINYILAKYLNAHIALLIGIITARCISSLFNYLATKIWVFKSDVGYVKSMLQYYSLVVAVMLIDYAIIDPLTNILGFNLPITKVIVDTLLFISNYYIQKKIIFKKVKTKNTIK